MIKLFLKSALFEKFLDSDPFYLTVWTFCSSGFWALLAFRNSADASLTYYYAVLLHGERGLSVM